MNYLLAIVCACITGIAIGIGINHTFDNSSVITADAASVGQEQIRVEVDENGQQHIVTEVASSENFDSIALGQMQEKLELLIAQQEEMKSHQSELNRELNAIQFRLDTHSESFRPLRSERDTQTLTPTPPQGLSPLLPPLR